MAKLTYQQMYTQAAKKIAKNGGSYKGYTGGNALSLYVYEKHGVNAAANSSAHDALCEAMSLLNDV